MIVLVDIDSLKRSEQALLESNAELRSQASERALLNSLATDRELCISELEKEVDEVRGRHGEAPIYPAQFERDQVEEAALALRQSLAVLPRNALASLESILFTEEFNRRPARLPDYATDSRLLTALAQALADSPRTILQTVAEKMLEVFQCGSAGFSLLTKDQSSFFWPAIAGAWQPHIGKGTPRDFGPCGDVLDCNAPLLFTHFERRYPYILAATPAVEECLLVPFYVGRKAVGTIWAMSHDHRRQFDAEDLRQIEGLARFASFAYQATEFQQARDLRRAALNPTMEDGLQANRRVESLLEELQLADRRKDEFLAMLAHELRNPMAVISMALSLLERDGGDGPRTMKYHEVARRQMGALVRLVDDLLDVSRITLGKVELRLEEVDLAFVVQNAIAAARPAIESRGHELSVTVSPGQFRLQADSMRLEQVLVNLLSNAAKYTEPGGTLSVRLAREERDGGTQVVVRVRDTGRGIPPEMLEKVFETFVQVSPTLDRGTGGLGLGLTLVKRLVEMHGGSVSAHSDGKGSEFVVRLPMAKERNARAVSAPMVRATEASALFQRRRVLVVDDVEDVRDTLKEYLEELGHEVVAAKDGLEGAACLLNWRPDIALVDVGLPGIDGYELARRVRADPGGEKLYLVALTGYSDAEAKARAEAAGFDLYLTKPLDVAKLTLVVSSLPR